MNEPSCILYKFLRSHLVDKTLFLFKVEHMLSDLQVQVITTEEELKYITQVMDGQLPLMITGTVTKAPWYVVNWATVVLELSVIMRIMVGDLAVIFSMIIHIVTAGKAIYGTVQQDTIDGKLVVDTVMM